MDFEEPLQETHWGGHNHVVPDQFIPGYDVLMKTVFFLSPEYTYKRHYNNKEWTTKEKELIGKMDIFPLEVAE